MHVCYISLYHIIYPIIDLPYIYIAILPYTNREVPFTTKVGIDRMDKVAKQLDKGHATRWSWGYPGKFTVEPVESQKWRFINGGFSMAMLV